MNIPLPGAPLRGGASLPFAQGWSCGAAPGARALPPRVRP